MKSTNNPTPAKKKQPVAQPAQQPAKQKINAQGGRIGVTRPVKSTHESKPIRYNYMSTKQKEQVARIYPDMKNPQSYRGNFYVNSSGEIEKKNIGKVAKKTTAANSTKTAKQSAAKTSTGVGKNMYKKKK